MRRALTLASLVGAALLLWLAAPALATRPPVPRAGDFEMAVPGSPARASAANGHGVVMPVLRAPKRFDLLGFRWRGRAPVRIDVRVRAGGRWSHWVTAQDAEEPGAAARRGMRGSDPVWAGGADAFQVRLSRPVAGLRVHFVKVTREPAPYVAHQAQTAPGAPPEIVPRADWGASQCPPRVAPSYGEVQLGFIHHTVSANDYGPDDSAAIVLAICRYHRNSNGWNDIGYNFLVDKYGKVFEGRAGGIDQPVIGAQAQGWNTESTGIANLGTYDTTPASAAAMQAMARLLAWKLPLGGAPVTGQVTVTSRGGSDNRYASGTPVAFERISGHRDGDRTACPGDALYAQLPQLREMAAGQAAPASQLVLSTPRRRLRYPATVPLSGRLSQPDGSGLGGAAVEVQMLGKRGFRRVASVVTAPDGTWSATVPTGTSRTFRAVFAGDPAHAAVTSAQVAVIVQPTLSARVRARRVLAGRRAVVSGTVRPRKPSIRVRVELRGGHGRYRIVYNRPVRVTAGVFRVPIRLVRAALYRVRAVFPGDPANAPAESAALYVRAVRGVAAARARR